ncbi:MAG: hypothetical protein WAW39_29250 [Prosthecobacter sp.]|uniref:hypothetical protein n=1 Tax=Prosthecobacter sp. TaxID=1965333 RepID=UPI003BB136ED
MTQEQSQAVLQSLRAMGKEEFSKIEAYSAIEATGATNGFVMSAIRELIANGVIVQCRPDQDCYRFAR